MKRVDGFEECEKVIKGLREATKLGDVEGRVKEIIDDVKKNGDEAVKKYTLLFDKVELSEIEVSEEEIEDACKNSDPYLREALEVAKRRIEEFYKMFRLSSFIDPDEGYGYLVRPIKRAGFYIPGGKNSYPSTVLMSVVPAKVAGVEEVIITTPPGRDGKIPSSTLLACHIAGAHRIFRAGGAQAIASMAFGTETIPKVDKIFGPGNIYVYTAKKLLFGEVGIDGLYGPTETLIIASPSSNPRRIAIDLLAQAEHDPLSKAILITWSRKLIKDVEEELKKLGEELKIPDEGIFLMMVGNIEEAIKLSNLFSPEHLSLYIPESEKYLSLIENAGGIFLGEGCPEAIGDYIMGPSHIMPTGGSSRFSSPLSLWDFLKLSFVFKKPRKELLPYAIRIAEEEGLIAHKRSLEERCSEDS